MNHAITLLIMKTHGWRYIDFSISYGKQTEKIKDKPGPIRPTVQSHDEMIARTDCGLLDILFLASAIFDAILSL